MNGLEIMLLQSYATPLLSAVLSSNLIYNRDELIMLSSVLVPRGGLTHEC